MGLALAFSLLTPPLLPAPAGADDRTVEYGVKAVFLERFARFVEWLAEALGALRPGLPVVLCTGFGDAVTADRAADLGIAATAHKPFTNQELASVVRTALDRRPARPTARRSARG